MIRMKKILMYVLLAGMCVACSTTQRLTSSKAAYFREFNQFIEKLKRDYPTYNSADWDWAEKKYDSFTGTEYDFYKGTFTDREKEEIGRLKGAYAKVKIKKTAGAMKEGLKDAFTTGKGVLKGLWE